jgi:hypothetical protein
MRICLGNPENRQRLLAVLAKALDGWIKRKVLQNHGVLALGLKRDSKFTSEAQKGHHALSVPRARAKSAAHGRGQQDEASLPQADHSVGLAVNLPQAVPSQAAVANPLGAAEAVQRQAHEVDVPTA